MGSSVLELKDKNSFFKRHEIVYIWSVFFQSQITLHFKLNYLFVYSVQYKVVIVIWASKSKIVPPLWFSP